MATEVVLHLDNGLAVPVQFEGDEVWELKDSDRLVLLLDGDKRVRGGCSLAHFTHVTVHVDDGE